MCKISNKSIWFDLSNHPNTIPRNLHGLNHDNKAIVLDFVFELGPQTGILSGKMERGLRNAKLVFLTFILLKPQSKRMQKYFVLVNVCSTPCCLRKPRWQCGTFKTKVKYKIVSFVSNLPLALHSKPEHTNWPSLSSVIAQIYLSP